MRNIWHDIAPARITPERFTWTQALKLQGYRMGYGKGYYDRFLNDFTGYTVGITFSECLSRYLPRGRFDAAVDLIVTDKRIIRPRGAQ